LLAELELSSRRPDGTYIEGGIHNPWCRPAVIFALETAMRMGEILSLQWADIDLVNRTATLQDTKNGEKRTVPLSTQAVAVLTGLSKTTDGRVLPITRDALKRVFTRACARANIHNLHFHDLRHEATSSLFERGLSVIEVSSITGHKTLQMLKRYTHLNASELALKIG
jgi:integrase